MVVSKNYKIKEQNGMYYIVPSSVPGCPQCGGEMKIRDSKRRKVIFADGTVDMNITGTFTPLVRIEETIVPD